MTLTLTAQEEDDLWAEAAQHNPRQLDPDSGIEIHEMPQELGKGHNLFVELYPECWLRIERHQYCETVQTKHPEANHGSQFGVLLFGVILDSQDGVYGNGHTMISGSGVQQEIFSTSFSTQPYLGINLEMSAEWLTTFFPDENGQLPAELSFLVKGNDWQTLIYPKTNPAIQNVAWQMINCPYEGAAKRLYLQAKSLELMALQLAPIVADRGNPKPPSRMKPTTIARIYEARDILQRRLENPPSSLELATAVGLSDRTLQRGFQSLFGTTVVGYLAEQRLLQAEQLLRERSMTVTEVAHRVGYGHLGRFAAAFKRKFGITPSQCLLGKKVILGA